MEDGSSWMNMRSITEQSDLEELMQVAQLAGTSFAAERASPRIVLSDRAPVQAAPAAVASTKQWINIPRRPRWTEQTLPEELHRLEQESFLEWRRQLAQLEEAEHFILTPFERNLEVWRQLWRVLEACNLIIEIVDARNPLLYYCKDLHKYIEEIGPEKEKLLLINKADFLSEEQRRVWAHYFDSIHMPFLFYSAKNASEELEAGQDQAESGDDCEAESRDHGDSDSDESFEENGKEERQDRVIEEEKQDRVTEKEKQDRVTEKEKQDRAIEDENQPRAHAHARETYEILDRERLLEFLKEKSRGHKVGMLGYPNVGKSSTINSLAGVKKVAVAATPGKTKHFQTVLLANGVVLYDCPGLVFPNFAASRADLVLNGILPIDQLREWITHTDLLLERVPRDIIERIYGIEIPKPTVEEDADRRTTASELLSAYAAARGFRTSCHGNPDESRAARIILKDYVGGKILFCNPPPGYADARAFNEPLWQRMRQEPSKIMSKMTSVQYTADADANLRIDRQSYAAHLSGCSGSARAAKPAAANDKKHYKMNKRR